MAKKTSQDNFLEKLEKNILAGKTLPTPGQEAKLQSNYLADRSALYRATVSPGVLPTDNSLEKKRFT